MTMLSRQFRSQALRAIRATGAFRSIRDSRWRGRRLLILGYHGVALEDEHEWDSALYISQPRLESQLLTLRSAGFLGYEENAQIPFPTDQSLTLPTSKFVMAITRNEGGKVGRASGDGKRCFPPRPGRARTADC